MSIIKYCICFLCLIFIFYLIGSCSSANSEKINTQVAQPKPSPTVTSKMQEDEIKFRGNNTSHSHYEMNFGNGLKLKRIELSQEGKFKRIYSVSVDYPQIEGSDKPSFKIANKNLAAFMTEVFQDFLNVQRNHGPRKGWEDVESFLGVSYELKYGNDEIVSIIFYGNSYGAGAANSSYKYWVANVDLRTGKILHLSDLFKPKSDYLKRIAGIVIEQKQERNIETFKGYLEKEFLPEHEKDLSWNITNRGLLISFEECRISCCACGVFDFQIPPDKLKDIVNQESVVWALWQSE